LSFALGLLFLFYVDDGCHGFQIKKNQLISGWGVKKSSPENASLNTAAVG